MLSWLMGKKTYLQAGLAALVTLAHGLGWIDEKAYVTLLGLLGSGIVASLRAGITKSGP